MGTAYANVALKAPYDTSGSVNNPATPEKIISSGTQPTNGPKVTFWQWLFDQSTDEHVCFDFFIPTNWASGATLTLKMGAKVTTGNVVIKHGSCPLTNDSTDSDAAVYGTITSEAAIAVPATTAGRVKDVTLTLSTTGWAAGRWVQVTIGRDANHASDTAAGDMFLLATALLSYTTT
jgi:hypothetical protein